MAGEEASPREKASSLCLTNLGGGSSSVQIAQKPTVQNQKSTPNSQLNSSIVTPKNVKFKSKVKESSVHSGMVFE